MSTDDNSPLPSLRTGAAETGRAGEPLSTPFGVLKLTLRPTGYSWQFISIGGKVLDSGTSVCH